MNQSQSPTPAQAIEDGAAEALKKQNPELFNQIETAILRNGQTPIQIDRYIRYKFGLEKGHPVRDLCYLTALSVQRRAVSS